MNFSKTYRRMNEPVGPSPDLIRKTLSLSLIHIWFFSVMSRRAEAYAPFRHSSIYSGMSWWMGQPPLQGAVKQSSRGTFS